FLQRRVVLFRSGGAGLQPLDEDVVGGVAFGEELAALVGRPAGRLAEQRARLGVGEADASAGVLAGDPLVIELGGVAAQREAEAVLAGALAVTGALVAAVAGEDGADVVDGGGRLGGGRWQAAQQETEDGKHGAGRRWNVTG